MLEELVVGMPHEESVGLSCHVLPAVDKLFELFVSKVGVWTGISWSFMLVEINCQNHHLGGEREVLLWIWNDSFLVQGTSTSGSVRSYPKVFTSSPSSFPSSLYFFLQKSPHILSFSLISLSRCFGRIDTQLLPTIQDLLESSNRVHIDVSLAIAPSQCHICLPNLVAHLVLASSLCVHVDNHPGSSSTFGTALSSGSVNVVDPFPSFW